MRQCEMYDCIAIHLRLYRIVYSMDYGKYLMVFQLFPQITVSLKVVTVQNL